MAGRRPVARGGMWSSPTAQVSKETQDLLKVMMEESKLTNFQRRHLQQNIKKGQGLPVQCKPTTSDTRPRPVAGARSAPKNRKQTSSAGRRPKEVIEVMTNGYQRETFKPSPGKAITEEDKSRLQNKMAFGVDTPGVEISSKEIAAMRGMEKAQREQEIDRFDEVLQEIEDRRQFLDEMEALGQGKKYRPIIAGEISLKIRELEVIDKQRSKELLQLTSEDL